MNTPQDLEQQLVNLMTKFRDETREKYNRVNPFVEDFTDWKERGEFLFGSGKNITVYNTCTVAGDVEVGEQSWIGPYTALDGTGGLKMGKYCTVCAGVNIISHDTVRWTLSGGKSPYEYAPITIGDYCFIGTGAMITKGVTIGSHCLIGAGAIVTSDVADYSIVGGVPAKRIGTVELEGNAVSLNYHPAH